MPDPDAVKSFARLLGSAGRAHHVEFGGPNEGWPEWYAAHIHPDIAEHVGYEPSVEEVADWLRKADQQHRDQSPERPWPVVYAELILDWVAG